MELVNLAALRKEDESRDKIIAAKFREIADNIEKDGIRDVYLLIEYAQTDEDGELYRYVTFEDRIKALGTIEMLKQGVLES